MEAYIYQPLGPGQIRLLRLTSSSSQELRGELCHTSLEQNPSSFAALSYTWGDPVFPHSLLIGDSYLPITGNLKDALVHIQRRTKRCQKRPRLLWVDALCINQADILEKNAQIALMSSLYVKAKTVYVWLGIPDNDEHVRAATAKMKYFYRRSIYANKSTIKMRPFWWPSKPRIPENPNLILGFDSNDKTIFDVEGSETYMAWAGIKEIWQKPWWHRAWILQESTVTEDDRHWWFGIGVFPIWAKLPRFKVLFLCGDHSVHWLGITLGILVADYLQTMPLLDTKFFAGEQEPARNVLSLRLQRKSLEDLTILELLQRFRRSECSNPRDKVYSLLGLANSASSPRITPDYKKPVFDVYLDIMKHNLDGPHPNLDFLGYAMKLDTPRRPLSAEVSCTTWPTWLPNWDDPLQIKPFPKMLYRFTPNTKRSLMLLTSYDQSVKTKTPVGKAYNASLDIKTRASISNNRLHLQGILIDTVSDLCSYHTISWDQRRAKLTEWKTQLNSKYGIEETYDSALARMQVADIRYGPYGSYPIGRGNAVNNALLGKPTARLTPEETTAKQGMTIALSWATSYRQMCLTEKEKLALVPWSAQKGDKICVLLGGQVLYVLRPVAGTSRRNIFEYIGECYVHGLMDGQAMELDENGGQVVEDVVLV